MSEIRVYPNNELGEEFLAHYKALVARERLMREMCELAWSAASSIIIDSNWAIVPESGFGLVLNSLCIALGRKPWDASNDPVEQLRAKALGHLAGIKDYAEMANYRANGGYLEASQKTVDAVNLAFEELKR